MIKKFKALVRKYKGEKNNFLNSIFVKMLVISMGVIITAIIVLLASIFLFQESYHEKLLRSEMGASCRSIKTSCLAYIKNETQDEEFKHFIKNYYNEELIKVFGWKDGKQFSIESEPLQEDREKAFNGLIKAEIDKLPRKDWPPDEWGDPSDYESPVSKINMIVEYELIRDENGQVQAYIFVGRLIQTANEYLSMTTTQIIILTIVIFVVIACISYFGIKNVTYPIQKLNDVAGAMAQGNFTLKADENIKSEAGQLAHTINFLSESLSGTITSLQLEKKTIQSVLDVINEGILSIDQDMFITQCNPTIRNLFGVILNQRMEFPTIEMEEVFREVIRENEFREYDFEYDGVIYRVCIYPIEYANGKPSGAVSLFRDITKDVLLEQTRKDYVANISHELRTPLTSIRALVEPMMDGLIRDCDTCKKYLGIVLNETLRLSRLISDLLELSGLQSGTIAMERHKTDLYDVMMNCSERLSVCARSKNVEFINDFEDLKNVEIMSNDDRLDQVLTIIIDNAIKFSSEGGEKIILEGKINHSGEIEVSVIDSGVGILEEDLPHIFERFYISDKSRTRKSSGLGLSIAMEIIVKLGMQIQAIRNVDRTDDVHEKNSGTTMKIVIPPELVL